MLENDELGDELDLGDSEIEEGVVSDPGEPLVGGRRRRRRRRRFDEDVEQKEMSLFEVSCVRHGSLGADGQLVPPLILAHPLPLLPMLAMLPYNFLPAGVVFFIPIICVLTALSSCAHIVIVYLSWCATCQRRWKELTLGISRFPLSKTSSPASQVDMDVTVNGQVVRL